MPPIPSSAPAERAMPLPAMESSRRCWRARPSPPVATAFSWRCTKIRRAPFRWTESDSAKAVAEASSHVKSYSCCRFVAVASGIVGASRAFRFASNVRTWFDCRGVESKGHKRKKQEEEKKAQAKPEEGSRRAVACRSRSQRSRPARLRFCAASCAIDLSPESRNGSMMNICNCAI